MSTTQTNTMALTDEQQNACDEFLAFLFSGAKEFIISGPGGAGKTYLMGQMINKILPMYQDQCAMIGLPSDLDTVVMTATTNKAADALSQSTNREIPTIHSYLRLKVANDYKTGMTKLTRRSDWEKHSNKIIFIDECSMIDSPLYYEIHAAFDDTCRIVYVGDHCQLPPVAERISPVYRHNIKGAVLTKNVRAAGQPALLDLCNQFRHTTETLEFKPIKIVPGVIDIMDETQLQAELVQRFTDVNHDSRILCYTNERVQLFNQHIRQIRGLPDHITAGELLINNSAFQHRNFMLSAEKEMKVLHVAKNSRMTILNDDSELEVYDVTLELGPHASAQVTIPADPDHVKALLKYYSKNKLWATYFELKEGMPDLRPKDACTVHKSQGSTYDTVIIDLDDIATCHNPRQVAHMLYVAVSRPRTRIILFGDLPAKYGGVIM